MRKIIVLAGLLMGGAMLTGTPAKADIGCQCVKLGAPSICTATVTDCNFKMGGVCVAPCVTEAPKAMRHHHHHKHMAKKKS
jgi:hypothetical protein